MRVGLVLLIAALVVFILAALVDSLAGLERLQLVAVGLALVAGALIADRTP